MNVNEKYMPTPISDYKKYRSTASSLNESEIKIKEETVSKEVVMIDS